MKFVILFVMMSCYCSWVYETPYIMPDAIAGGLFTVNSGTTDSGVIEMNAAAYESFLKNTDTQTYLRETSLQSHTLAYTVRFTGENGDFTYTGHVSRVTMTFFTKHIHRRSADSLHMTDLTQLTIAGVAVGNSKKIKVNANNGAAVIACAHTDPNGRFFKIVMKVDDCENPHGI